MVLSTSIELHDFPLVNHGVRRLLDVPREFRRSNVKPCPSTVDVQQAAAAGHTSLLLPISSSCTPQHQQSPSYFFGNDPPPRTEALGQVPAGRIVYIPSSGFFFYLSAPSKVGGHNTTLLRVAFQPEHHFQGCQHSPSKQGCHATFMGAGRHS
jgi:hypothetical protein